jgi:predicted site-specific integrase-resolvase
MSTIQKPHTRILAINDAAKLLHVPARELRKWSDEGTLLQFVRRGTVELVQITTGIYALPPEQEEKPSRRNGPVPLARLRSVPQKYTMYPPGLANW